MNESKQHRLLRKAKERITALEKENAELRGKLSDRVLLHRETLTNYEKLDEACVTLKAENAELRRDKEILDFALRGNGGCRVQLHMGYNNFSHEHVWKQTINREDIVARIDAEKALYDKATTKAEGR